MLDFKTSLLLKIISSIFFLLSGIVWKKILVKGRVNYHLIFYRVITTFFLLLTLSFWFPSNNLASSLTFPFTDWIVCITICLFSFWGLYFYTEALKEGRLSFIAPLNGIASVFSIITSVIIYNEVLNVTKYISLLFFSIGVFIHQKDKLVNFKVSKEVFLTLLFSIIWGISFVLYLIPIKKFGVFNFSLILEICVFISCVGLLLFKEKRIIPPKLTASNLWFCILMGFLVAGGSLLSNFTLTQFPVSLNILIGLLFELIVLAVGLYFFREKLNNKDWFLIVIATIGGFLLLV